MERTNTLKNKKTQYSLIIQYLQTRSQVEPESQRVLVQTTCRNFVAKITKHIYIYIYIYTCVYLDPTVWLLVSGFQRWSNNKKRTLRILGEGRCLTSYLVACHSPVILAQGAVLNNQDRRSAALWIIYCKLN